MDLIEGSSGLELSLKLYHAGELQPGYQQLMSEAPANLESLKGTTFLLSKKDKNKKVELKEYVSPKDRKDGLALFVFPRTVDGKPSVDVADEEVQFVAEPAGLKIKTAFKLSKMMTDGKLDI